MPSWLCTIRVNVVVDSCVQSPELSELDVWIQDSEYQHAWKRAQESADDALQRLKDAVRSGTLSKLKKAVWSEGVKVALPAGVATKYKQFTSHRGTTEVTFD